MWQAMCQCVYKAGSMAWRFAGRAVPASFALASAEITQGVDSLARSQSRMDASWMKAK
jgi:hypothetical protein